MPNPRRHVPVALVLILGLTCTSCFFTRTRNIFRGGKKVTPGSVPSLLTATRDELNTRIENLYNAINSFQATVEMTPSVGSVYTGHITEITDVHAYVLFRKPSDIHIIGQLPVVRTQAFNMSSDGSSFKLLVASTLRHSDKPLFIEGSNDAPATSKNKLENLRPRAFLSSMLIRPAGPDETPVLEDATDEDNALYILHFVTRTPEGGLMIARNVWFDRLDLSIVRQKVLDEAGSIISDTRYAKWTQYSGVQFPAHIDINRPKDGYGLVLDLLDMKMNLELTNAQFELSPPAGSQLQVIGAAN
jgi:outer membrane lipoprotein-sorting protein